MRKKKSKAEPSEGSIFSGLRVQLQHSVFARALARFCELTYARDNLNLVLCEDERAELHDLIALLDQWWRDAMKPTSRAADEANDKIVSLMLAFAPNYPEARQ